MFDVKILYREPVYELWSGHGERCPYVAAYPRIVAADAGEAQRIAEALFRATEAESGVRWARQVVEVVVRAA